MRIKNRFYRIFVYLIVSNFINLNLVIATTSPSFFFRLKDKTSISETFLDSDLDGRVDFWYLASSKSEMITVAFDKLGRIKGISIKKRLSKFNAIIEFKPSSKNLKISKILLYKPQVYSSSEDSDLFSKEELASSATGEECNSDGVSENSASLANIIVGIRTEAYKEKVSNACDKNNGITKQTIVDLLVGKETASNDDTNLLECMERISKIVDSDSRREGGTRCDKMIGAFGSIKNLLNLDIHGRTNFSIDCQIDGSSSNSKCVSGNFVEATSPTKGDMILLKLSPQCSQIDPSDLKEVVLHEMIHRAIPSAIAGKFSKDSMENAVQAMTNFCMSKSKSEQELCAPDRTTKLVSIGQLQETQQKITQQEVPVDLAQETPVNKVIVPNAFPSINQYLGSPAVVAAAAPTGFPAVQSAQARVTPVLNFARSMMGSVGLAQASEKFDPNKTYSYDSSDSLANKHDSSSGGRRSPASEASVPLKAPGAEGSVFNPAGSAKPSMSEGSSARSPAQIAGEKAKSLVKNNSKLSGDQKKNAEKVLAYVLNAKNKTELKTFLIHKKRDLDALHIHIVDASANEVFGFDDPSSANMTFSISGEGKLIDETLEP